MSDDFDGELDDLEDLLSSAVQHANRLRARVAVKRVQRTAREVSQDYAERLAEKAVFRRLLSDEALDGVRFRWLIENRRRWNDIGLDTSIYTFDQMRAF